MVLNLWQGDVITDKVFRSMNNRIGSAVDKLRYPSVFLFWNKKKSCEQYAVEYQKKRATLARKWSRETAKK